jgi:hypothetical protein
LTVVEPTSRKSGSNMYWLCRCRCGKEVVVRDALITRKKTKSCGCLVKDILSHNNRKHGKGRTPEAAIWRSMIARCHNPKNVSYKNYGSRGISVCLRWRNSFVNFLNDMGKRPANHHLDRINNAGNYRPSNCRWVTAKVNQRNRRNNVIVTHLGVRKPLVEWAEITGINYGTLWGRHNKGWREEKLFSFVRGD